MAESNVDLELELLRARTSNSDPLKQVVLEKNKTKYFRDLIRTAAQGVSFGTMDEIEAYVKSKINDSDYTNNLEIIRGQIAKFAEENPKTALAAEIGGSLPTAALGGAGLARVGVKGAMKVGGIEGAAYGFGKGEGDVAERGKSAITSGALSAAGSKAGDIIFPKVTEAAKRLMKEGVRLTPGQRVGGIVGQLEERATSMPIVGDVIESAQQTALGDFNRAAINTSLSVLDEDVGQRASIVMKILGNKKTKVPKNLEGQAAYQFAKDQLDEAYAKVIPKLKADVGGEFEDGLVKIIENNLDLGPDGLKTFQAKLQKILASKVTSKDKILRGEVLKDIDSSLGLEATNFKRSANPQDRNLGDALQDVQNLLRESMKGTNPQASREYKKVQRAFRTLLPVRKATVAAITKEGRFTPAQLLRGSRASDRSRDKIATATGKAPLQEVGSVGEEVIGRTIPDSGSAERAALLIGLNKFRQNPGVVGALGLLGTLGTGAVYQNPLGRSLTTQSLAAPGNISRLGSPAVGAMSTPTVNEQISRRLPPTIEQLRLLEERFR
jgi:hypothetical protein